MTDWLESTEDLMSEPYPAATPFLVAALIVDRAIAAIQGQHKVTKTWALLEIAFAVVTGRPAFGRFAVAEPGPVMVVLEESGRTAFHRRLLALARGHGVDDPADLRDLYFAANQRVRLDDYDWQAKLIEAARTIRPRLIAFDPLARVKGSQTDEDSQKEMAPILDFLRLLRDESGAAVAFVHHTGHGGTRMRGTSDLEAYWESKLSISRRGGDYEIVAEHREAEGRDSFRYRLETGDGIVRLTPTEASADRAERVLAYVHAQPGQTVNDVIAGVGGNKGTTRKLVLSEVQRGTLVLRRSERPDLRGTLRSFEGVYPAAGAGLTEVPESGPSRTSVPLGGPRSRAVDPYRGSTGPRTPGWSFEDDLVAARLAWNAGNGKAD